MATKSKDSEQAQETAEKVKGAKVKPLRKITLATVCGKVKGNAELMKEIISADGQADELRNPQPSLDSHQQQGMVAPPCPGGTVWAAQQGVHL